MNKQQLASTIWESANQMRSKIEANEYKDYILGFIFYKYLSDMEISFFKKNEMSDADIALLDDASWEAMDFARKNLGYYIKYDDFFSTWISKGMKLDVSDVRSALQNFAHSVKGQSYKMVFDKVFLTLEMGLTKLGESASAQAKAIRRLIALIARIPMDKQQDYDVLGFIYEYLIGMFAANAGKKAGEFYTPHEVSVLMSEIIAEYLKGRDSIRIYDPTSGSGSLLINIGRSAAKYIPGQNKIKYYAQELKENTYNLTRMNLVMRGISPGNISLRNADALEEDWPEDFKASSDNKREPLRVDAVVSNPPYSQHWDNSDKDQDPRFKFGVAPKSKADYAFLLHALYHVKDDGIMTIVLPHGVLFRGEEREIRENLVEHNHLDAIIGLPENIFFGTSIATIIMVLKRNRPETDVLIIDASRLYEKVKKNNRLRSSDIRRIADCIRDRQEETGFSAKVSLEQIQANDYNLNIPRYVDSAEAEIPFDLRATMLGGIPKVELAPLASYFASMPGLYESLFAEISAEYVTLTDSDPATLVAVHPAVEGYRQSCREAFGDLAPLLQGRLLDAPEKVNPNREEENLWGEIQSRLERTKALDKYSVYQILDDAWQIIGSDIEAIKTEGREAVKTVMWHTSVKIQNGELEEVQEYREGRILPFDLVQREMLPEELAVITRQKEKLAAFSLRYEELLETFLEDEREGDSFSEDGTEFVLSSLRVEAAAILGVKNPKPKQIEAYLAKRPPNTYEYRLVSVLKVMEEEKTHKRILRQMETELEAMTVQTIESLTDEAARHLLDEKWISPLMAGLYGAADSVVAELAAKVKAIAAKYADTFEDIETEDKATSAELLGMVGDLTGGDADIEGLEELKRILGA